MALETDGSSADAIFKALSDPTRRQILRLLRKTALPAGSIANAFTISGPSISRHLSVLKMAGLVSERREANRLIYSLQPSHLANGAGGWLLSVCPDELSGLVAERRKKKEKLKAPKERRKGPPFSATGPTAGTPFPLPN